MLDATSNMPQYQWKLTIVERNLRPSNWSKLILEAQEQMLWEADILMEDLPLIYKSQLLTALENLQGDVEEVLQQQLQQIVSKHSSHDIHKVLELSLKNNTLPTAV
jgi:hypothetical protein